MAVVRISKGSFAADRFEEVRRLIAASFEPLSPALRQQRGLLYYHAGVDRGTSTVTNVSVWVDLNAAKQMDGLAPMLGAAAYPRSRRRAFRTDRELRATLDDRGDWDGTGRRVAADHAWRASITRQARTARRSSTFLKGPLFCRIWLEANCRQTAAAHHSRLGFRRSETRGLDPRSSRPHSEPDRHHAPI